MDYNLQRFIDAQNSEYSGYATALSEIKAGRKVSHWIWYIFPQVKGLGFSYNSEFYGIDGKSEAAEYLKNEVLGVRLREITSELLKHKGENIEKILGYTDAMKVRSSMTLFDAVCPNDVFADVLKAFYFGAKDEKTLMKLV